MFRRVCPCGFRCSGSAPSSETRCGLAWGNWLKPKWRGDKLQHIDQRRWNVQHAPCFQNRRLSDFIEIHKTFDVSFGKNHKVVLNTAEKYGAVANRHVRCGEMLRAGWPANENSLKMSLKQESTMTNDCGHLNQSCASAQLKAKIVYFQCHSALLRLLWKIKLKGKLFCIAYAYCVFYSTRKEFMLANKNATFATLGQSQLELGATMATKYGWIETSKSRKSWISANYVFASGFQHSSAQAKTSESVYISCALYWRRNSIRTGS